MESLEQINDRFLKIAAEVNEYMKYLEQQDCCLRQSLRVIDQKALYKSRKYITDHKDSLEEKEKWAREEWKKMCKARMFDYEELGKIIARLITQKEGTRYFSATRLVKHTFQVDEVNRPFYRIVSFITSNRDDLVHPILEKLSATMTPYYIGMSPIMKPLPRELVSLAGFEQMLRRELEARESLMLYASTTSDVVVGPAFIKPENQAQLKTFPFDYINAMIDSCIRIKYENGILTQQDIKDVLTVFGVNQEVATSLRI